MLSKEYLYIISSVEPRFLRRVCRLFYACCIRLTANKQQYNAKNRLLSHCTTTSLTLRGGRSGLFGGQPLRADEQCRYYNGFLDKPYLQWRFREIATLRQEQSRLAMTYYNATHLIIFYRLSAWRARCCPTATSFYRTDLFKLGAEARPNENISQGQRSLFEGGRRARLRNHFQQ